ncbi:MAG TPA: riboflavin synthase [Chitinophagaceae bacterium]|nr:riboflavin synthase [Chitinophagaceae bacterium]
MFTGIIETTATLKEISASGTNKTFLLSCPITDQLTIDQSIAHNGVCLTVEAITGDNYQVTAIAETLQKTNLGDWKTGDIINLERCLQPSGRLDGHFVQGHTDTKGVVTEKTDLDGSWQFTFSFDPLFAPYIIEKGSVAVNGISLTAFDVKANTFSVAIIPYTYQHTNLQLIAPGSTVNLEFDMLGKYIIRWAEMSRQNNLL